MIGKDWVQDAALEINAVDRNCHCSVMSEQIAEDIITKHCPFKPDVVYMPVPRCETCSHATELPSYWIRCRQLNIEAPPDFGCVQWEEK